MLIWDDARTTMQRLAQDSSSAAVSQLDLMANVGYKKVLNILGRQVTEKVKFAATVPTQRGYQLPPDAAWVKSVSILTGNNATTKRPLEEVQSEEAWDWFTTQNISGEPTRYFYRPRFGHGGGILELDPIPSSDDWRIRLTMEANDKDLSKTKYNTGTISVTKGSTAVVGVGTTFAADMEGRYIRLTADGSDRLWYRVKDFTDTTHLVLENVYEGETQAGAAYEIAEAFNLPEDLQMAPLYYSLWHWWETKKDPVYSTKFKGLWDEDVRKAKTWHGTKTRGGIVHYQDYATPYGAMPPWFPESVT